MAKAKTEFKPSMQTLSRILNVFLEKNTIGRTELAKLANLNYTRLTKHVDWLERKSLVELMVENRKMNVKLTSTGRDFAKTLNHEN